MNIEGVGDDHDTSSGSRHTDEDKVQADVRETNHWQAVCKNRRREQQEEEEEEEVRPSKGPLPTPGCSRPTPEAAMKQGEGHEGLERNKVTQIASKCTKNFWPTVGLFGVHGHVLLLRLLLGRL